MKNDDSVKLKKEANHKNVGEEFKIFQECFHGIFDSSKDGIAFADLKGILVDVNDSYSRLTGYSKEELLAGKKYQDITPKEYHKYEAKKIEELLKTGKPAEYEKEYIRKDGSRVPILLTIFLVRGVGGKSIGAAALVKDITERKQQEEELERLNKDLIKSNKRLKQLTLRDLHTGLYNHHYLTEIIEAEFDRARRYAHPLSVIMIDIDYFKSINDVYGHRFGDLVLKQFARQLKMMVRRYDILIRFGGEEFVVISPGIELSKAMILARRLLETISLYNFGDGEHTVKLKLSVAVASYPEDRVTKGIGLIELIDQILGRIKDKGGGRIYSSQDIKRGRASRKSGERSGIKFFREKIDKLSRKANRDLVESIFAFAKAIELKDHYTGEHTERTVHYAMRIAETLGLRREDVECVKQAAILHDLGKIGISEKILHKKSKLTKEEFEEIKKHPQIGVDIIRPIHFMHNVIPLMFYHHERWDGKGYPIGLKKEEIPIGARIIAIADVYQALTSDRPYRKAYPKEEAVKIIKKGSGTQFDPKIVNTFLKILQQEK